MCICFNQRPRVPLAFILFIKGVVHPQKSVITYSNVVKEEFWSIITLFLVQFFRLSCALPRRPHFGEVSVKDLHPGGTAHFQCHMGYHLQGDATLTCLNASLPVWSQHEPSCRGETPHRRATSAIYTVCVCVCVCVCVYIYIYVCVCVCIYIYMCVCVCVYIYIYMCVCVCVCVCVCIYVCVCVCVCVCIYGIW